jgi:hypothetical protein
MKIIPVSILCPLLPLAFLLTACSGTAQTASLATATVATAAPTITLVATQPPLPSPTLNPIHGLGQLVEVNGLTLAMLQVAYNSGQLQVLFAAKNTGSAVLSPSGVSLSATTGTGATLKWVPCMVTLTNGQKKLSSAAPFSGNLQPGEILKGTICWDGTDPQNGNQVGYAPDFGKPATAFWDVSTADQTETPAVLAANTFATPPHTQGDSVALKDITITFDKVTLTGFINAYFTVENRGSIAYKFNPPLAASPDSSPLDDSFSFRLADGSPYGSGIFMNSSCQDVATGIEVLPGQKRTLDLCFGNYDTITSIVPGALVSFIPSADQGDQVNWLTK